MYRTSLLISMWVWSSHPWAIWNIHIWSWVPYKHICIQISASKYNRNMTLVSKNIFFRSTIALDTFSTLYHYRPFWNPRWPPLTLCFYIYIFNKIQHWIFLFWIDNACTSSQIWLKTLSNHFYWYNKLFGTLKPHASWTTGSSSATGVILP